MRDGMAPSPLELHQSISRVRPRPRSIVCNANTRSIVDFDTGSADLFLPASTCGQTCDGHTLYNPNASSTAVDRNATFILSYGDGTSVQGEQYADTVIVGGYTVCLYYFPSALS